MTDRNIKFGDPLTTRETQIRELVCEGLRTKIIARKLQISPRTVDAHRGRIMKKMGVHTTAAMVRITMNGG